jgi:penicillin-binding protein 1A
VRKVLIWSVRIAAALLLAAFLLIGAVAGRAYWQAANGLPDHRLADGASWHGCVPPEARRFDFVPLSAMPAHAADAFLAAEEPDFLMREAYHPLTEVFKEVWFHKHFLHAAISGYYANGLLYCQFPDDRSTGGALYLLKYRIERDLPRRAILETVMNTVYFGRGAYGMPAAAQRYFQKPLAELSTADLAFLASLPRAPFDVARHLDRALKRRNEVLDRMADMGALTAEQVAAAKLEPLNPQI